MISIIKFLNLTLAAVGEFIMKLNVKRLKEALNMIHENHNKYDPSAMAVF